MTAKDRWQVWQARRRLVVAQQSDGWPIGFGVTLSLPEIDRLLAALEKQAHNGKDRSGESR